MAISTSWDLASRFEDSDPHYQLSVTVAQFAEILREDPYIHGLSLYDLARRANHLASQMREDDKVSEFADLVNRAAAIHR